MHPIRPVLQAPPADTQEKARTPGSDIDRAPEGDVLTVESSRILSGRQEVAIRHNGRTYRLRCTRLGKLILTA